MNIKERKVCSFQVDGNHVCEVFIDEKDELCKTHKIVTLQAENSLMRSRLMPSNTKAPLVTFKTDEAGNYVFNHDQLNSILLEAAKATVTPSNSSSSDFEVCKSFYEMLQKRGFPTRINIEEQTVSILDDSGKECFIIACSSGEFFRISGISSEGAWRDELDLKKY